MVNIPAPTGTFTQVESIAPFVRPTDRAVQSGIGSIALLISPALPSASTMVTTTVASPSISILYFDPLWILWLPLIYQISRSILVSGLHKFQVHLQFERHLFPYCFSSLPSEC